MDFKVEVSLWNMHGGNAGQAALQINTPSDFSDRLGLNKEPQSREQRQDAAQHEVDRGFSPAGASLLTESNDASAGEPSVRVPGELLAQVSGFAELYSLGLHAGRHLSHMPYGFFDAAGQASQLYDAMSLGLAVEADIRTPATQQSTVQAEFTVDAFSRSATRLAPTVQGIEAIIAEQLSLHLAQKWPERSVLLLPRGNDIELLVRDYHLTEDEKESLVAELLARLQSQTERPQRIWINGQCVWQRATSVSIQGEKQHGY